MCCFRQRWAPGARRRPRRRHSTRRCPWRKASSFSASSSSTRRRATTPAPRIAPFLGLEPPTGNDADADSFGTLPASVQLGSGSWDPFGGLIATDQTLDYQLDAQLSYKANTKANDFEFGDELRFDASLQYRLWPRELGDGVPGFLYGVIETNVLHQAKNRSDGVDDPDSGGTTVLLSPGLQYVTKRWVLEGIVQLPVAQDLNGSALEDDFTVRAGFRVNF